MEEGFCELLRLEGNLRSSACEERVGVLRALVPSLAFGENGPTVNRSLMDLVYTTCANLAGYEALAMVEAENPVSKHGRPGRAEPEVQEPTGIDEIPVAGFVHAR